MSFWNKKKKEKVEKYKEIPFQHLAPIDTVKDKTTFDALDYALSQDNIHNVALTGNYGAGKSSILESYIKRNKNCWPIESFYRLLSKVPLLNRLIKGKKWFLKISLATFAVEDKEEDDLPKKENRAFSEAVLQKIEKSILQQILYRKSGVKLPNSRFIRIKRTNKIDAFVTAFVVLALFIVLNYFIQGEIWEYICKPFTLPLVWSDIALSASVLLALFLFLYKLLIFVKKLRIAKLCFSNAEIEFKGNESEESLLNKYLDELLYFFEVTGYNVIIFEDLDRFNNTEIFIKLRELNTLLNNYENIHHKIVFIYALRDEVFTDSSRTKFFDFIVPVIPVINSQNSSDMLLNQWKENRKIDESFLQDIGLYIDDMRLLKNSINEFKIYDKKVNEEDYKENNNETDGKICRDRNKIFALILYKNLYPNDFALLAQNKGELYGIFQKKKDVMEVEIPKIENSIVQLEKQIETIENQVKFDIKELRVLYVAKIFSKKPKNNNMYIVNDISEFLSDEEFEKIRLGHSFPCSTHYGSLGTFNYDFFAIEKEVNPSYSYKDRENMLKKKINGGLEKLKKQLAEKRTTLFNIQQMSIAEMLDEFPSEQFVADVKTIKKDFIIYLLRCSYIDENYFEYISYFYANSLSVQEKQYLLLIKNKQDPNFELLINNSNFGNIVTRIKDVEWKLPAVLNYSMLYCILTFDDIHIDVFLNALWNYKVFNRNGVFLSKFNGGSNIQSKLYQRLYDLFGKKNNWIDILFDNEESNVIYNFLIYVYFEKAEKDVITFLTKDVSYLHRVDVDRIFLSSKISYYGLKFNLLEDTIKYPIYNIILDNNAYIISKQNFDIIIKNAFADTVEMPIKDYYTQISKLENQNVKTYVDQNIDAFVKDIVIPTGDSMAESEEAFVELLNNENLKTETKAELIEKNNCVVSDIAQINGAEIQLADGENKSIDIRNLLYKCKKVSPTWSNVFENFKYNGNKLDLCLVEYLNDDEVVKTVSKERPLSSEELKEKGKNHDIASTFYNVIMRTSTLSLNSFSKLMDACPWIYNSLGTYDVSPEKMDLLIKMDKLSFTKDNYLGIKQNYFNLLSKYISICFNDFLEKWSELKIKITFDDMKLFLDSDELNKEQKNRLLSSDFDAWYTVNQKDSLMWLGRKILELNFEGKIQVSIASVITNMDDADDVLKLLCLQGRYLKDNEIIDLVNNKLDESYRICIKRDGKREKLPNTSMNKELCAILSEKEIISSYQEDGKKIKVIQKRM